MKPSPIVPAGIQRPFARSYALMRDRKSNIKRPRAASQPYGPGQLPAAYGWPTGIDASPLTIVIGELGGAPPSDADIAAWVAKSGHPSPTVRTYLLPGADNSSSEADGEVSLDVFVAADVWSYITGLPANILLIYGPNTGQAFADVMNYGAKQPLVGAGSWSWGSAESQWASNELAALDAAAQASPFPWTAASGDNGSNDGTNSPTTDAPASSPYLVGCGGTSRPPTGPETVWNNGDGEGTGGGFSKLYPQPTWQPANSQGTGRMVPDLAAVADPNTGYEVIINGQWQVIGGTSAVAPLIAGFLCAVNGVRLKAGMPMISQANPILWGMMANFLDVVSGNNGSFRATTGPDPCTGLGRPLGTLFSALTGSQTPPNPPPIIPPPPPGPGPSPTPTFSLSVPRTVPAGSFFLVRAGKVIPAGKYQCFPASGTSVEALAEVLAEVLALAE